LSHKLPTPGRRAFGREKRGAYDSKLACQLGRGGKNRKNSALASPPPQTPSCIITTSEKERILKNEQKGRPGQQLPQPQGCESDGRQNFTFRAVSLNKETTKAKTWGDKNYTCSSQTQQHPTPRTGASYEEPNKTSNPPATGGEEALKRSEEGSCPAQPAKTESLNRGPMESIKSLKGDSLQEVPFNFSSYR